MFRISIYTRKHRKKLIIFGADTSLFVSVDNKNKDILIIGEGPRQGLDDTILRTKAKFPINFTRSRKVFVLSLHYSRSNSFLFVDATEIYQFKAKDSEIKPYPLCLGNFSKDFTIDNLKKNRIKRKIKKVFF